MIPTCHCEEGSDDAIPIVQGPRFIAPMRHCQPYLPAINRVRMRRETKSIPPTVIKISTMIYAT